MVLLEEVLSGLQFILAKVWFYVRYLDVGDFRVQIVDVYLMHAR